MKKGCADALFSASYSEAIIGKDGDFLVLLRCPCAFGQMHRSLAATQDIDFVVGCKPQLVQLTALLF